jgi:hypothetical protein
MNEFDMTRQQRDTAIGIGAARSVFEIALDRKTYRRQLATNLMMTTSEQANFD